MLRKFAGFAVVAAGILALAMPASAVTNDHYGNIGGSVHGHVRVASKTSGFVVDVGAHAARAGNYDVSIYVEVKEKGHVLAKTSADVCTLTVDVNKGGDDCTANVGHLLGNGIWGTKMTITIRNADTGRIVGRGVVKK